MRNHGKQKPGETIFDHIEYHASIRGMAEANDHNPSQFLGLAVRSALRPSGGGDDPSPVGPKLRMFARFVHAYGPDDIYHYTDYHFFLGVLTMVRTLLGLNWKLFLRDWAKGPSMLPAPCVEDVLCNLYNVLDARQIPSYEKKVRALGGLVAPPSPSGPRLAGLWGRSCCRACVRQPLPTPPPATVLAPGARLPHGRGGGL